MLEIKVNDKVKVFKKNIFSNKINKTMVGIVKRIEEWEEEDDHTKMLFRKYEFEPIATNVTD
ncbi:hypothetical protein KPL37_18640 [Clostridium frigoris]|uniref:DUF2187 domain-containing protein n=1 Tax=Clostridium frigoris TaxID=205327 RepID=A0ABS6BYL8_9CLOT|nr:hypothetical protein [Clostridium frigoris]MBU3161709.1 hypothetical protein [Clostridium frigoris]